MQGMLCVNNTDAFEAACVAGLGLIQVPEVGVKPLLARQQLIEVLPRQRAEPMPVSILYAQRRNLPRRVKLFMAWLTETLQPHLL